MSYAGPLGYERRGDEIRTIGVSYGPRVELISEKDGRMLWKVPGHNTWSGNYQPWKYYGTVYLAVQTVGPGLVEVIRQEQPGRHWRRIAAEMQA